MQVTRITTVLAAVFCCLLVPDVAFSQVTAFTNVNVIPMDHERILRDQTVIVRDGRVVTVGPAATTPVPAGAVRIEARGKYLIPGLAEMHAHIPPPPAQPPEGYDWDAFRQWTEDMLFLNIAAGITTVRGMLGHASHLELRQRVERGELIGPRIWTSGPSVNGNSVPDPGVARRVPAEQKAAGFDFMKIHPGLSLESFDVLVEAAGEAGIGFAGHVPNAVGVPRALEAGYLSIDHLDGYVDELAGRARQPGGGWFGISFANDADDTRITELARRTREAGVWNVPTQTLMLWYATDETADELLARPELRYIPSAMRTAWGNWKRNAENQNIPAATRSRFIDVRNRLIKALHDEGAGLLLGSDAPQVFNVPGFGTLRELQALVDAGLTPYEALRTGTWNVAEFFGVLDHAGTIEIGKQSDMVLLNANPLEDIANVWQRSGTMIRGRWLPAAEVGRRLEAIAARYAN